MPRSDDVRELLGVYMKRHAVSVSVARFMSDYDALKLERVVREG